MRWHRVVLIFLHLKQPAVHGSQHHRQQCTNRSVFQVIFIAIPLIISYPAIFGIWNWGWTWQGVTINNCQVRIPHSPSPSMQHSDRRTPLNLQVGFDITTGTTSGSSQGVASEAIIDATVTNTPVFFRSSAASNGALDGSIVLNNIVLNNVPTAVGLTNGAVVLKGGTTTINTWVQGYVPSSSYGIVC